MGGEGEKIGGGECLGEEMEGMGSRGGGGGGGEKIGGGECLGGDGGNG